MNDRGVNTQHISIQTVKCFLMCLSINKILIILLSLGKRLFKLISKRGYENTTDGIQRA